MPAEPERWRPFGSASTILARLRSASLTEIGAETAALLRRLPRLDERERSRLRRLTPWLSVRDIAAIAADPLLANRMHEHYETSHRQLDLPLARFLILLLAFVAGLVMIWGTVG